MNGARENMRMTRLSLSPSRWHGGLRRRERRGILVSPGSSTAEKGAAIRSIIQKKDDILARLELELAGQRERLREAEVAGATAAAGRKSRTRGAPN